MLPILSLTSLFLADNSKILSEVGEDREYSDQSDRIVGDGGNIDITTGFFSATNGTALRSSTFREGNAGDIKIIAPDGVLFSSGSGVFSEVEQSAIGNGGNIDIITDSLYLNQNAQLSSNTSGIGRAGNIFVNSPLLRLRRGSSITTNASGNNITGGNITIDGKNGFIIAVPKENSDIRADSANFRGGKVTIRNTAGIYGTESRKEPSRLTSDITAKGATPELSGDVEINTPEADPTRALVELPVNIVDTSNQISDACTPGSRGFGNSFVSVGRGGLPMTPTEPLQDTSTISTWVKLKPQALSTRNTKTSSQSTTVPKTPKVEKVTQIVEATGWIVDENGNIEFVEQANQSNPKSPWQNPTSCSASE